MDVLIEDKIEKLERWVGELSADKRRLQEQVETLRKERNLAVGQRDHLMKSNENNFHRAEAAEAERDRLRELLHLVGMSAGYQYMTMETRALIDAALQKEPQP